MAINLPSQPTLFVGREDELAAMRNLLGTPACRLLTLTGPGGIGKTRLATEAARLLHDFSAPGNGDGGGERIVFVSLQPLTRSDFIVPTIAETLRFTFYGEGDPRSQLLHYLRGQRLLLLLDNFEHLLDGVGLLPEILEHAPGVKLLVTSRERLRLHEEWVFEVPGLSFPDDGQVAVPGHHTAIQLFAQSATRAGYVPQEADAPAIARICQVVEGIPLAIELAAAWVRVMPCAEIAHEVERSLDILTTTTRNVPEKHRSMRAAFQRSWDLLTGAEQAVFRKLSVFRGGFTREGAEQVAGASLAILASLVDKSLLRMEASGRYDLHELLRQYAADKLRDAGEQDIALQQHYDYCLQLAEGAEAHAFGREQVAWFDHLEAEMDNLRAALAWSEKDVAGLRLAGTLGWFLSERTHWREGFDWLERMLAANPDAPASLRAKALHNAGALAGHGGDTGRARPCLEQALALAQAAGDAWNTAWSLAHLGIYGGYELDQAAATVDESLALFRALGDSMGLSHALIRRSWSARQQGDYTYVCALVDEADSLAREAGDKIIMGWAALELGLLFRFYRDLRQARIHFANSLSLFREANFPNGSIRALFWLADVEQSLGNTPGVQLLMDEALILLREVEPDNAFLRLILGILSDFARMHKEFKRAATLFGAENSSYLLQFKARRSAYDENSLASYKAELVAELGEAAFAEAWAVGYAMTREQAIAYALQWGTAGQAAAVETSPPNLLTGRELEILQLSADGLNSREIAERLVLSVGTVRWYLKQIYSKLDAHSRSQAIAHARSLGLLSQGGWPLPQ